MSVQLPADSRWTVEGLHSVTKHRMRRYSVVCKCGARRVVLAMNLRNGASLSCGCLKSELISKRNSSADVNANFKHGAASTPNKKQTREHTSWSAMIQRSTNPNAHAYENYGGRGISVCAAWRGESGFIQFLSDMGLRPQGKTLDRFPDPNGDYTPLNCRWATAKEQAQNRRAPKSKVRKEGKS